MQYAVVGYDVHEWKVSSFSVCDSEEEAISCLRDDAMHVYMKEDERRRVARGSGSVSIEFFDDDTRARVESVDFEYIWTWEIVEF